MTRPADGDVLLLVGTTKGAFLLHGDPKRRRWTRSGPRFAGRAVYAMAYDGRHGRRRIWAAGTSEDGATVLRASDDFGRTWPDAAGPDLAFPAGAGASLSHVWQIAPGRGAEPERMWCGAEPAALFESRDAGATWSLVHPLWEHPDRPRRMIVAISAGGVYRTEDAGATWTASNAGLRADGPPCVHKVARAPGRPDLLWLQNHSGVYRSEDDGRSWREITSGLPSDFGFAIATHPRDPFTAWVVPLESDRFRVTVGGKLRVFRTRDGGLSWSSRTRGLPQKDALETVLREALCTDTLDPCGVYLGTRGGKLWASRDEGRTWSLVADGLPPIVCVKAAVVGRPLGGPVKTTVRRKRKRRPSRKKKKTTKKQASKK